MRWEDGKDVQMKVEDIEALILDGVNNLDREKDSGK